MMTTPTIRPITNSETGLAAEIVRLIRPKQWIKNAFVFAPLIFSGNVKDGHADFRSAVAFAAFCLTASIGYVVNDLCDSERDREHPLKRLTRPIASGAVSKTQALIVIAMLALAAAGLLIAFQTGVIIPVLAAYLLLTLTYSFKLKHMPVLDLFSIALGFVLRVYAGAFAIHVHVSFWMFGTTLCLAIYLACIKRRQELILHGPSARGTLSYYSADLLNSYALVSAICAVNFYGFYLATMQPRFAPSMVFVLFGFFRYQYLAERLDEGESPTEVVWKDPYMALAVIAWGLFAVVILK
jgi:decaprenyl-phosphate phosphoribosyltransferase